MSKCPYCLPMVKWFERRALTDSNGEDVAVVELVKDNFYYDNAPALLVDVDVGDENYCGEVPINFCPKCGRDLRKADE